MNVQYLLTYEQQHVAPAFEAAVESAIVTGLGGAITVVLVMNGAGVFDHAPFWPSIVTWWHAHGAVVATAEIVIPMLRAIQGWIESKKSALAPRLAP